MIARRRFATLFTAAALVLAAAAAEATPMPTVPAPGPFAPGFLVQWVQVAGPAFGPGAPHSIADAEAILNGTTSLTVVDSFEQFLTIIDLQDADVPFAGADPVFAIKVSGYIFAGPGSYSFLSFHDEGLQIKVGGETVVSFAGDTPNVATNSAFYDLPAGVYRYEAISWEQGRAFNLQLGVDFDGPNNDTGQVFLEGVHVVPEPGTLSLFGFGLVGAARAWKRRVR